MGGYDKGDAAKDTESSISEVSAAHHEARSDSGVREGKDSEHFKEAPSWADKSTPSGISFFPSRTREKSDSGDSGK